MGIKQKLTWQAFEVLIIWPLVLLVAVALAILFVVCLPFILYSMAKKRWWMTDEEREALESSGKGRRRR